MRKRSAVVILTVGFMALVSLAGCPKEEAPLDYVAVCEDDLGFRHVDEDCDTDGGDTAGRHWSHYPTNVKAPAVGQQGTGRVTPPAGANVGRAPASGGFGTYGGGGG